MGHGGAPAPPAAHVVFCVDNSRSMRTLDARDEAGSALSRAAAVVRCCDQLVKQQLQLTNRPLYSHILFDDNADVVFTKRDLGPGSSAERLLHSGPKPRLGTCYSAAWLAVEKLVDSTEDSVPVHVVFLSDGRPGELSVQLPQPGSEKATARVQKQEMASAPATVRQIAEKRGQLLTVHAVAIGNEDPAWLKRLVSIAEAAGAQGSFMNPQTMNLQLTEPAPEPAGPSGAPPSFAMPAPPPSRVPPARSTSTLGDAFSQISSALTSSIAAARPRVAVTESYEERDAWQHNRGAGETQEFKGHRLGLNADGTHFWDSLQSNVSIREKPFAHGGQRNAFHLFYQGSAHVDPKLCCPITRQLMVDPVVKQGTTYERAAIERQLLEGGAGARGLAGWALEPNLVVREMCRDEVRKLRGAECDHFVAKESRFKEDWNERLSSHKVSMRTALKAQVLAEQFNLQTPPNWPLISVLPASIYRLVPAGHRGAANRQLSLFRYVSVEPFLHGDYKKLNGNNGYIVDAASELDRHQEGIAQAFTHWTYAHSLQETGSECMVCDIQGVGYQYTDVNIHSEDRQFGKTDLGEQGFEAFFSTHRCNDLCARLGLPTVSPEAQGPGPSRSTATSAIQIIRTRHLNQRKRQRDIETREMQAAVKHGRKEPGNAPGSVRHSHNGVAVVTDREHRVGITAFPTRQ